MPNKPSSMLKYCFHYQNLVAEICLRVPHSDNRFLSATSVPAGTAESAETCRYGFKARRDRDSGSSPYDSLESLVSYEVISCHWVRRFPWNEGIKEGYPLRNRYFTIIGSSSVKTVADRHRFDAYHNKHCRRAFQRYQHR